MPTFNHFDFEQRMLDTWNVTKDLETLLESILDNEADLKKIPEVINGVAVLYSMKFEGLLDMYKDAVARGLVLNVNMEDSIMNCWTVVDNMETAAEGLAMGWLDRDGVSNALLGAKTLADVRFQKIIQDFEGAFAKEERVLKSNAF